MRRTRKRPRIAVEKRRERRRGRGRGFYPDQSVERMRRGWNNNENEKEYGKSLVSWLPPGGGGSWRHDLRSHRGMSLGIYTHDG